MQFRRNSAINPPYSDHVVILQILKLQRQVFQRHNIKPFVKKTLEVERNIPLNKAKPMRNSLVVYGENKTPLYSKVSARYIARRPFPEIRQEWGNHITQENSLHKPQMTYAVNSTQCNIVDYPD